MAKKQTSSSIPYWEKRRELEDKARLKMEDETIKSLTKNLTETLEKIQAQLLSQADLHNITQQELLEDYSLRDQKKYKKYIEKNFKELMKSDEKYQEFIDEFFPSYDYAKVNRLLQMRSDIFNTLASEMIKTDPNKKFNDGLEEIINKMYNSNSNALMNLLEPGDFNPLPKKELDNMLNYPWSGKTFSNRLWGNISRLEQNLSNAIVNSVSSGQGVVEALKTMKNDSRISDMFKLEEKKFKNAIENLVRTEYAHFAVTGLRKSMSDAGIKETQSWSAEDERVCSICGSRHGKVIKDNWHPPYHGRCRCTEIPKMPELGEDIDKLYDEMFGDLLDEFAKDKFGIKLNKLNRLKEIDWSKNLNIDTKSNKLLNEVMNRSLDVGNKENKELLSMIGLNSAKLIYESKGTNDFVEFSEDLKRMLKKAPKSSIILNHNHPSKNNSSFSKTDIFQLYNFNSIKAMTLVTKDKTSYYLDRNDKYFNTFKKMMFSNIYDSVRTEILSEYKPDDYEKHWKEITDKINQKVSKKIGIKYRRL